MKTIKTHFVGETRQVIVEGTRRPGRSRPLAPHGVRLSDRYLSIQESDASSIVFQRKEDFQEFYEALTDEAVELGWLAPPVEDALEFTEDEDAAGVINNAPVTNIYVTNYFKDPFA